MSGSAAVGVETIQVIDVAQPFELAPAGLQGVLVPAQPADLMPDARRVRASTHATPEVLRPPQLDDVPQPQADRPAALCLQEGIPAL